MTQKINYSNRRKSDPLTAELLASLRGLRYGSVLVTVHDGKVVQIDRSEKVRFDNLQNHFVDGDGI